MADQITLRKGDHTVTTTVPREAYNLEARGYTRVKPTRSAPASAEKKSDKK